MFGGANVNSLIASVTFSIPGGQAVLSHAKLITSHPLGYIGQRRKNLSKLIVAHSQMSASRSTSEALDQEGDPPFGAKSPGAFRAGRELETYIETVTGSEIFSFRR